MELPPLEDYDTIREKLKEKRQERGWNQSFLASKTKISNSYISRIESGEADEVSYRKIYKMWEALREDPSKKETPAKDICTEEIDWARPTQERSEVADEMIEKDYSQVPVKGEDGDQIGSVTESGLINVEEDTLVEEFMGDEFPEVQYNDSRKTVKSYLEYKPAVLVKEEDEYIGIITKTNLIKHPE